MHTHKHSSQDDSEGEPGSNPGQIESGEDGGNPEKTHPHEDDEVGPAGRLEIHLPDVVRELFVFDVVVNQVVLYVPCIDHTYTVLLTV